MAAKGDIKFFSNKEKTYKHACIWIMIDDSQHLYHDRAGIYETHL